MTAQCPEAIIGDDGFVIQCGLNGGHKGKHVVVTDRGTAEWPRIEATPLADWEIDYAHQERICERLARAIWETRDLPSDWWDDEVFAIDRERFRRIARDVIAQLHVETPA